MARLFVSSAGLAALLLPGLRVRFVGVTRDPVHEDFCFELEGPDVPDAGEVVLDSELAPAPAETVGLRPIASVRPHALPASVQPPPSDPALMERIAQVQDALRTETKERQRRLAKHCRPFVRSG
jgi:hypothetical protein